MQNMALVFIFFIFLFFLNKSNVANTDETSFFSDPFYFLFLYVVTGPNPDHAASVKTEPMIA